MIRTSAFQTRARTVDHLGREQIADCPTAISELWKNAFDAFARQVELNIYAGDEPVAAIVDDGHGMTTDEFTQRWLVVGTEAKATIEPIPIEDRNGLDPRPRQGQKGIGRLSCANLGPVLLLVSKRRNQPFVSALVDWRLFENPFINLADILIPVAQFQTFDELFGQFPNLVKLLSENITGGLDSGRRTRILDAWSTSDEHHIKGTRNSDAHTPSTLSSDILSTIAKLPFKPEHFQRWPVALGDSDHGTALLVAHINYDLRVHLDENVDDAMAQGAKDRFFETLSSFVDPFIDKTISTTESDQLEFKYTARVWTHGNYRTIVGSDKQFDKHQVDGLEHRLEGQIDRDGIFSGRVKAFGRWLNDKCVIDPPSEIAIPHHRNTELGPLRLYISSMEFDREKTTHTSAEFEFFQSLAAKYAGFMIFRDGLRVLPYGRTDNDFFDIESRRTKHLGREFWNHRQMFGRLAITRLANPNLKDKAGREGLLDNRAAKTLKVLISNILKQSARRYFGSESVLRKELLPTTSARQTRQRAEESRQRLRRLQRTRFRSKLRKNLNELDTFLAAVGAHSMESDLKTEQDIIQGQRKLDEFRRRLAEFQIPDPPQDLGSLKKSYDAYLASLKSVADIIAADEDHLRAKAQEIVPAKSRTVLEEQLANQAGHISSRLQAWVARLNKLQGDELQRLRQLSWHRQELFKTEAKALLHRFDTDQGSFADIATAMNVLRHDMDQENQHIFVSYIDALESLGDNIDLEVLATFGMEEIGELRSELERLNALAQLGIAVEILGHELQAYDEMIGTGLSQLPEDVRDSKAVEDIQVAYQGLTDQLRFLSPLRLAGPKVQSWITGREISNYIGKFFQRAFDRNSISFSPTNAFHQVSVFDQRSRLYPVFINLVNNSIYWLANDVQRAKEIVFDIVDQEVVVSDNGPGVHRQDIDNLFRLFFTRKVHGGRGVGLYLCRANLTASRPRD